MDFPAPPSQVHATRLAAPKPPCIRGRQTSKRVTQLSNLEPVLDTTTASSSSSFDACRRRPTPHYVIDPLGAFPPPLAPSGVSHSRQSSMVAQMRQRAMNPMMQAMSPAQPYGSHLLTPTSMTPKSSYRSASLQRSRFLTHITVECVDCSPYIGRCGLLIFFLLTYGIKHRFEVLPADIDLKQRISLLRKKRGGFVKPTWPICSHNHLAMTEPYAALRYLAKHIGLYGTDPERDYYADSLLETFAYWRDSLSALIREAVCPEKFQTKIDDSAIDAYLQETRPGLLDIVEQILELNETCFFLSDELSWVDPPVFSILYEDNVYVYLTVKERVEVYAEALQARKESEPTPVGERIICRKHIGTSGDRDGTDEEIGLKEFEDEMNKHVTLVEDQFPRVARFMDSVPRHAALLHGWLVEHRQIWNLSKSHVSNVYNDPMNNQSSDLWMLGNELSQNNPDYALPSSKNQGRWQLPLMHRSPAMYVEGEELLWAEAPSPASNSNRSRR